MISEDIANDIVYLIRFITYIDVKSLKTSLDPFWKIHNPS